MSARYSAEEIQQEFLEALEGVESFAGPDIRDVKTFIAGIRLGYQQRIENEGVGLSSESLVTDLVGILSSLEMRIAQIERSLDKISE